MRWNNSHEANYRGSTRKVKEKIQAKRKHIEKGNKNKSQQVLL